MCSGSKRKLYKIFAAILTHPTLAVGGGPVHCLRLRAAENLDRPSRMQTSSAKSLLFLVHLKGKYKAYER